jgi:hydrogenase maturation protein HypF
VGTVQGVGFRPFVYRLATQEQLAGYVLNDEQGVLLEVEGEAAAVDRFMRRLTTEAPPLAVIDAVASDSLPLVGEPGFEIRASFSSAAPDAPVTPDSATCADCLAELFSPADRRFRYPFINCTNCGPRFTILRGVPYDRPQTTMARFVMCPDCRREYGDPLDRRFHAQPNACPVCGPSVRVLGVECNDPVSFVAAQLGDGRIAAVKGLGGYHLACDASNESAVARLRARKHREDKPFALMIRSPEAFVDVGAVEQELLASPAAPIVLAPRLADAPVAFSVAPGAPELGVMLPYTPLHHLLMADFAGDALVMTSGNVSDEPIAFADDDALVRLAPIADLFLVHDREIETRTDDSVVRVARRRTLPLRRSRGYVPGHLALPFTVQRPLLACGAEQKSTFCVAKGSRAWVSHHIGDLEHFATVQAFRDGIAHFERLFAVTPEVVAHDLHPGYLSTAYALEREGVSLVGVQHHHAHLAACLAEHGVAEEPAVGAIFDGTGYGTDGAVWGGELLIGDLAGFERAGSLWPVRMPGAAAAIRQPWRMAFAWLAEAFGEPRPPTPGLRVDPAHWEAMKHVAFNPSVSPVTSSMGRLFDAVGALCGIRSEVTYEGQAAVELEAAAWRAGSCGAYSFDGLDPRPAVREIVRDLVSGVSAAVVAARFHAGVAAASVAALTEIAAQRRLSRAVLSGGVFQNRLLLELVCDALERAGLEVLVPRVLPVNDGGISYGQAAIGGAASYVASGQVSHSTPCARIAR